MQKSTNTIGTRKGSRIIPSLQVFGLGAASDLTRGLTGNARVYAVFLFTFNKPGLLALPIPTQAWLEPNHVRV